jgi:proteasome assembly chaperone (PAC2) family protein
MPSLIEFVTTTSVSAGSGVFISSLPGVGCVTDMPSETVIAGKAISNRKGFIRFYVD